MYYLDHYLLSCFELTCKMCTSTFYYFLDLTWIRSRTTVNHRHKQKRTNEGLKEFFLEMWIKQSKQKESQLSPDCKLLPPLFFVWEPAEWTVHSDLGSGTDVKQSDTLADSLELISSEKRNSFHISRIKKKISRWFVQSHEFPRFSVGGKSKNKCRKTLWQVFKRQL